MKIFLLGPYPPPYGGVSVHVKRLYERLKDYTSIKIHTTSKNKFFLSKKIKDIIVFSFFLKKEEIYHIHESSIKLILMLSFINFIRKNKMILTIHNDRFESNYDKESFIIRYLLKKFLKNINHIILVGNNEIEFFYKNNIKKNNISVIPGYINPVINREDYLKIDKQVWKFINDSKEKNEKIITANGNIRFFNNEDLYGLDLLIELIHLLKKDGYKVSLLFALLGYGNQTQEERNYFEELENRIKKYQLDKKIFIYKVKDTEYYPILDKTDIFIRPTNTDGYGISVTEAIYLKRPAIASDVCQRQKGTIYFKSRDIKDLLEKTKLVLNNYNEEKNKLKEIEVKEYYKDVLEIYKKVYEGKW